MDSPDRKRGEIDVIRRVGARVRHTRAERRLTMREVAERSGVSLRFLSQLEAGKARQVDVQNDDVRLPGFENLERLVGAVRLEHIDVLLPGKHATASLDHHGMVVDDKNAHSYFNLVVCSFV